MSKCPACLSTSTTRLFEVTAEQASRHFINRRQYADRSQDLIKYLSHLWGGNSCSVRRCGDCGFGFADPFVAGGAEFYNLATPHVGYPTMKWEYKRTIEEFANLETHGRTAIDVGAGFGLFLDVVTGSLFQAADLSAIEYNATSISLLEAKGIRTFSSDIQSASFEHMKEAFDFIFMFQVVEHMDRMDELFARLSYLLKPQGAVFIAVPNQSRTNFQEQHDSLLDMPPNHIGRWTKEAFDALCRRHGLLLTKCEQEPFNLVKFLKQDITYSFLRRAQKPGSVSEFVRGLPRNKAQQIAQGLFALALSPLRFWAWIYVAKNYSSLGGSLWVKVNKA